MAESLTDARGDVLVAMVAEDEASATAVEDSPCPLALVVVRSSAGVLFGLNRWRGEWELPGGMIERGETPRVAAARELAEETGVAVDPAALQFAGTATFDLVAPPRRERAAVYTATVDSVTAHASDELVEVGWCDLERPPRPSSLLDLAIARWAGTDG